MISRKWLTALLVLTLLIMPLTTVSARTDTTPGMHGQQQGKPAGEDNPAFSEDSSGAKGSGNTTGMSGQQQGKPAGEGSLRFDENNYTEESLTIDDETINYRAYEGIVYVSNPVDTYYQSMNVFVPASIPLEDYDTNNDPIFLPNKVGGYNPGEPANVDTNEVFVALSKGYVVAAPGARGRTLQDEEDLYYGKAPACIVDLKAAVRYLRYNDKFMPGSAERIISSGTSAGGALSSLLGATGNNKDYEPYLKAIGAANARDDIFATNCYCPITNLDNSDTAYEWLFNGINDYTFLGGGTMNEEQIEISNELKALFPDYLNSLGLKAYEPRNDKGWGLMKAPGQAKKGSDLTLDADGEGTFKDYVESFVIASAQKALEEGIDISGATCLTIEDGIVTDVDLFEFAQYATRMKPAPAFDALNASSWENSLFGTATIDTQHFTQFSYENSTTNGTLADEEIIKMLNPMYYIGARGTTTASYWRIRHGAVDRDTSLAIPVILATKLQNKGFDVDFAMPWGQGHGGNYDLEELFDWIGGIRDAHRQGNRILH